MAGLLLHLAMGIPERLDPGHPAYSASERRAYALGLLLPDIAKIGSIGSAGDFGRFFEGCSEEDIPTFEEYLRFAGNHHFNPDPRDPAIQDTRNPNLADFFSAGYADLKKPVWKGVFCHLMGDKAFYYKSYCVDDPRAMEDYRREAGEIEVWDSIKWRNSKTGRIYYEDYNILNRRIEDEFGVLERLRRILPDALVKELLKDFTVGFSAAGDEPVYMNLENIRKAIAVSRSLCRRLEEGKAEEVIRYFDGNKPDEVFCGPWPDAD